MSGTEYRSTQQRLRLFKRIIFVDWFGTLSTTRFWGDITNNAAHPLSSVMAQAVDKLFTQDPELVKSWMRGEATESIVIERLELKLPSNYRRDYLIRSLWRSCREPKLNKNLLLVLRDVHADNFIAVASDNMSCFARCVIPLLSRHPIDQVLISAEIGVLKREDPERFFGPTLRMIGLTFSDALLVDDDPANCQSFARAGGTSILYRDTTTASASLTAILSSDPTKNQQFSGNEW